MGDTERLRRAVDLLVSFLALLVLVPAFLVVAAAVKLETRGPAFFRQDRVGRGGRSFRMLKFRSMVADAGRLGPKISGHRDPRITRVGRLLRATKIDELPQLCNVLVGEMTLVGPRAEIPEIVHHYTEEERELLRFKPGLTGPGQIYFTTDQAGDLDEVEDAEDHYVKHHLHPKLAMDLEYVRNRTWKTDLAIVGRTVLVMLRLGSRR